jgi:hypothetical protein
MLISETTEFKSRYPGATIVVAINAYSSHTTTLEYKSPDSGTWVEVAGTSATTNWGGTFSLPVRFYRIKIVGGTGTVEVALTRKWL